MSNVVGQKIIKLRPMTDEEMEAEGWEGHGSKPSVIVLENGTKLYPSRDSEGNGGGSLFGVTPEGKQVGYF